MFKVRQKIIFTMNDSIDLIPEILNVVDSEHIQSKSILQSIKKYSMGPSLGLYGACHTIQ